MAEAARGVRALGWSSDPRDSSTLILVSLVSISGGAGFLGLHLARRRPRGRRHACARSTSRRSTTPSSSAGVEELRGDVRAERDARALVARRRRRRPRRCRAADPVARARRSARSTSRAPRPCSPRRSRRACAASSSSRRPPSTACRSGTRSTRTTRSSASAGTASRRSRPSSLPREFGRRGLDVVIVRPKTFIGPERLGVFEILFDWIREGRRIPILGDGWQPLPAARGRGSRRRGRPRLRRRRSAGEALNVGAGVFGTVRDDLQALIDHAGSGSRLCAGAGRAGRALAARARARAPLAARRVALQDGAPGLVRLDRAGPGAARLGAAALERRDALRDVRLVPRRTAMRCAAAGTTHRVPWNQQALGVLKRLGRQTERRDRSARARAPHVDYPHPMRDLLDYRSEFPILEHTTYLINHSLAAMPAKAEERLAEYARMWKERGIRSWGEGWWTMPMTVGDQIGRIIGGAAGHDGDAPERRRRRGGRALLRSSRSIRRATASSTSAGNFPSVRYLYQAQPGSRGRRLRGRRGDRRRDRRADPARPDQPRPLQDRRDPGRSSRSSGARTRSART